MKKQTKSQVLEMQFINMLEMEKESFYRIAYSYMRSQRDALEVIQDSVGKAYGKLNKVKSPEYMKTWFTRIVINTAKDDLKKRKRLVLVDENSGMEIDQTEIGQGIEDNLDLRKAFRILNEKERIVLTLRYFEDKKLQEIEKILDLPLPTIKSTVYRALKKLRIELEEGVSIE